MSPAEQELSAKIDDFGRTALRLKAERDALLAACKFALKRCEENGFPHGDLATKLRDTIEFAEESSRP
jgi:hypothetical protein